jgi:hypothetical protein
MPFFLNRKGIKNSVFRRNKGILVKATGMAHKEYKRNFSLSPAFMMGKPIQMVQRIR